MISPSIKSLSIFRLSNGAREPYFGPESASLAQNQLPPFVARRPEVLSLGKRICARREWLVVITLLGRSLRYFARSLAHSKLYLKWELTGYFNHFEMLGISIFSRVEQVRWLFCPWIIDAKDRVQREARIKSLNFSTAKKLTSRNVQVEGSCSRCTTLCSFCTPSEIQHQHLRKNKHV